MTGKLATLFIPILHNEDYTAAKYSNLSRINSIWVKRVPTGNVTITTQSEAPPSEGNTGAVSTITLPPTAFIAGQQYFIMLKSISYANGGDQSDPPLVAFI